MHYHLERIQWPPTHLMKNITIKISRDSNIFNAVIPERNKVSRDLGVELKSFFYLFLRATRSKTAFSFIDLFSALA